MKWRIIEEGDRTLTTHKERRMVIIVCVVCGKPFSFLDDDKGKEKKTERAGLCPKHAQEDADYEKSRKTKRQKND